MVLGTTRRNMRETNERKRRKLTRDFDSNGPRLRSSTSENSEQVGRTQPERLYERDESSSAYDVAGPSQQLAASYEHATQI
ncbi:unnamed protein product [Darwinula stevensoni]|uniref:Uncharacterized protein n=1 Tax=Darwinula stevensoni TaxID=69355 RepID=A0A7R9A4H7_9CRUS|nr:unnamed protein product [Darwinula stevensoni]CAG0892574.1 unnamed protein product [Darwinula stevensoni]